MKKGLLSLIITIVIALFIATPAFADGPFHCPTPFQPPSSFEGGGVFEVGSSFDGGDYGTGAGGIADFKYKGTTGCGAGGAGGNTRTNVNISTGCNNLDLNISSGGHIWSNSLVRPLQKSRPQRP